MAHSLPPGLSWRRPKRDDVADLFAFLVVRTTEALGVADVTVDDVADSFDDPEYDADRDGWLVLDATGGIVAYGWACRVSDSNLVNVEVLDDGHHAGAGDWLWNEALTHAAARAGAAGHDHAVADIGIYRNDERQRAAAVAHGFVPAAAFYRMRIDHDPAVASEPELPPSVLVRDGPGDEALRRAAHAVHQASFAEHFGFVATPFDEWHESFDASSIHDWSQLQVAEVDGEPVAVLIGNDQFVADANCGYVRIVGVVPSRRGRGLARLLLERAFARDVRAGREGTILHVDSGNTTPALGLYQSVGMRTVLVIDVWRRQLSTTG